MRELLRRLQYFLHRSEFDRDLNEEMEHHLALSAEQRGSTDAARRQFGNLTLIKEDSRTMWTGKFVEQCIQDLRYGLRSSTIRECSPVP